MKNNISITNLTQIHVGSGETLQKNTDYIVRNDGGNSDIYVIDPDLIGKLIGTDQRAWDQWLASIERGDTNRFFDLFLGRRKPADYSKRRITNFVGTRNDKTLKECMHDGLGRPYLPGSSIKGAIRTAIISYLASSMPKAAKENIIGSMDSRGSILDERGNRHKSAEDYILGDTPNENLMRFIRVGDAFYDKETEIAVTEVSINQRLESDLMDYKNAQAVEAIGKDERSSFSLYIDQRLFDKVYDRSKLGHDDKLKGMRRLPSELSTIPGLFQVIKDHTKRLVESEITYWKEQTEYTGAEDYIESMEEILENVNSCKYGECVIRIGQASGWRFMTGAWTEGLDNFYNKVVPASRPNNERKYKEYDFPKSRRIDDESYLFGFAKLQMKR